METSLAEECRVAILEPISRKMVSMTHISHPKLPRVSVPRHVRHAEAATRLLAEKYGLLTIQLAVLPCGRNDSCCAVHELLSPPASLPQEASFIALNDLPAEELNELERMSILLIQDGDETHLGRFAKAGWIEGLMISLGFGPDRGRWPRIRQLNQSIDFCLMSLTGNDNRTFWFKAVGYPNLNEFRFTTELSRRFPSYLPKIVQSLPEWNAWITSNVDGVPLHSLVNRSAQTRAFEALAFMQKALGKEIDLFVAMGAKRWMIQDFEPLLAPFLEEMEFAMQAQTNIASPALSREEIRSLGKHLKMMLTEIAGLHLEATLVHGDIGHGNVLVNETETIFLDWAETYAGNPFVCAEHLLADLGRSTACPPDSIRQLRWFYSNQWKETLCAAARLYLVTYGAAFGALACALMTWHINTERGTSSSAWPFLRSMIRRTRREIALAVGDRA